MNNYDLAEKYSSDLEGFPCNTCGAENFEEICARERFGLPLRTVICKECGLIFINPRPTKENYAAFYQRDYRQLVSGSDEGDLKRFNMQVEYVNKAVIPLFNKSMPDWQPKSIFDIGCSEGGILYALMQHFPGSRGYGLEPVLKIASFARDKTGATIYKGLFEDYHPQRKFDLIVFSRALNHSLDPRANLTTIREMLTAQGVFVLILINSMTELLRRPLESVTEMTHPYMYTPDTILYILDQVGLRPFCQEENRLDARQMKRHDYRKWETSLMRILSRRDKPGSAGIVKPEYSEILSWMQANQAARRRYAAYIDKWRKPNIFRRLYRKMLHILRCW